MRVDQATELLDYRRMQHNMSIAVDLSAKCVFVITLVIKAHEQIAMKKYFSALKARGRVEDGERGRVCDDPFSVSRRGSTITFVFLGDCADSRTITANASAKIYSIRIL